MLSVDRKAARVLLTMDGDDPRRLFEGKQMFIYNKLSIQEGLKERIQIKPSGFEADLPQFLSLDVSFVDIKYDYNSYD